MPARWPPAWPPWPAKSTATWSPPAPPTPTLSPPATAKPSPRSPHEFEDLGANLYAAEAHAEAAVLLRQAGKPRDGAAAERHAARLLARCEGAATPPVQNITARARLTPGEFDTARQAAAGRSNKQIASDLHLSVRTIEGHLQWAYAKLGISGRHELAEALRDQPPPDRRTRS